MTELQKRLFALQDKVYKEFHQKLMPTVNPDCVIGIRTPVLRKFAKDFAKEDGAEKFLKSLPHKYYEENNLHAFLLMGEKDFDTALAKTEEFLPYIDNWATCDVFKPKIFAKNTDRLIGRIYEWIKSGKTYTVRYGIGLLMSYYLDENFKEEYAKTVSQVRSDEYYINMMIAWYFATALAKQYDSVIKYLTEKRLPDWVHNKTIQKAVESFRISPETKEYLKTLRIKGDVKNA